MITTNTNYMNTATELTVKTCTGLASLFSAIWVDTHLLFTMIFALLLIDNVAALYRFYKQRKQGVSWFHRSKFRKTLDKFISYGIALIVGWILQHMLWLEFGICKFIAGYIAIYEGISIFSHLGHITGLTLFSDVVDWLKEKADFKKYFSSSKQKENESNK